MKAYYVSKEKKGDVTDICCLATSSRIGPPRQKLSPYGAVFLVIQGCRFISAQVGLLSRWYGYPQ
ncbi:hypothetical protein Sjap_025647 [Stephania japonica]|uniref:Uncharacterized protein n=1 Tax=Stephania japonica TaxID=461633 RepID=A0AAP0E265_9MAGN